MSNASQGSMLRLVVFSTNSYLDSGMKCSLGKNVDESKLRAPTDIVESRPAIQRVLTG